MSIIYKNWHNYWHNFRKALLVANNATFSSTIYHSLTFPPLLPLDPLLQITISYYKFL